MIRIIVMMVVLFAVCHNAGAENVKNTLPQTQSLSKKKSVRFKLLSGGMYQDHYYAIMKVHTIKDVKTYWINPGFGGIAPELDLSASENIKSYSMDWGMPKKVTHSGLTNYIIPDGAELALRLTPHDPMLPMVLKGTLYYGYCDIQCKADTQVISKSFDINDKGNAERLKEILAKKPVLLTEDYAKKHSIILQEFFTQNVAKDYLISFTLQGVDVNDDNFFYSLDTEHELMLPIIQKINPDTYRVTIDTQNLSKAPKKLELLISRHDAPPLKIIKRLKFTQSPI